MIFVVPKMCLMSVMRFESKRIPGDQAEVEPLELHEVLMGPLLLDFALADSDNHVGIPRLHSHSIREAAKNNGIFLVPRPLRGGRGDRAWPRKKTFFEALKKIWKKICGH